MSNVLIVYAHPEPTSFSAALVASGREALERAGHTVVVSDLHAQEFNPVAGRHDFVTVANPKRFHYQSEQANAARQEGFSQEVAREQRKLETADVLVLVFPLWWGAPPAILKGWFDRVLAYGFAYVDGARFDTGLFRGRRAMLAVTTGGTPQRFSREGVYGELDRVLWSVQRLVLQYMGFETEEPFMAYAAPRVSDEERRDYMEEFARRLVELAGKPIDRSLRPARPIDLAPADAWAKAR